MDESGKYVETYRQEAEEYLGDIEEIILDIEQAPENGENINRLFRAIHTIKGSGAMFGFEDVAAFTHHLETVLDKVRDGIVPVTKELIDLVLASRDHIKSLLDAADGIQEADIEISGQIIAALENLTQKAEASAKGTVSHKPEKKEATYRIRFRPDLDIFKYGTDPALLLSELRSFGECKISTHTHSIPPLGDMDPEACHIHWNLLLTTRESIDTIKDVFIFVEDNCQLNIDLIEPEDAKHKKLGEILVERGDLSPDDLRKALKAQKRVGEILVETQATDQDAVASVLMEQQYVRSLSEKRRQAASGSSIRVTADKLDRLINLVGELVITQARLRQISDFMEEIDLSNAAEEVERLTSELRDCALNMRMIPIGTTFGQFRRLIRDLSAELGKEIDLVTEGGETELDKTVIERLKDPLVHLIRNSIDHGIRAPEERERNGKHRKGIIRLAAAHESGRVAISIEDDGMGMNPEDIRAKAVEKGLISKTAELSETEIFSLIFIPGFSTSAQATSISGRGVGMDVVKREIDALGGSIQIISKKGRGLCINLSLPLTLAIIDGLLLDVGGSFFVLPLAQVEACAELTKAAVEKSRGRNMILVREDMIPFVRLREFFAISDEKPPIEHIAIVHVENVHIGIVVDKVIDKIQTVIKSLDRNCQNAPGVSGATIMGNGTVALIIDVPGLIRCASREEEEKYNFFNTV